jgi:hypothetical protein
MLVIRVPLFFKDDLDNNLGPSHIWKAFPQTNLCELEIPVKGQLGDDQRSYLTWSEVRFQKCSDWMNTEFLSH